MNGVALKERILSMKGRVDKTESELIAQMNNLSVLDSLWNEIDSYAEYMRRNENHIVNFNVCGKRYSTKVETLLNIKDTFFYKLVTSKKVNLKDEIFISRDPKMFSLILDYLRKKTINLKRFSKSELVRFRFEAEYFELNDIINEIGDNTQEIDIVGFEFSGPYMSGNVEIGTNKLEDVFDKNLYTGGICATSPGYIIFELNKEWEIESVEVGGYGGNTSYWSVENGYSATIEFSTDKDKWTNIGSIPSGFGSNIATVRLSSKKKAKWVRFKHNSLLGIGYVHFNKASS
jgi:hypothetical protein